MESEIDFNEIINKYRSDPFDYVDVCTAHTGRVRFKVRVGTGVEGPAGEWRHLPGTLLYTLSREGNTKRIHSSTNGTVDTINEGIEGHFVEAGEKVLTIRHPLKKREIIEGILQKVLYLFPAPERAKYFFSYDIQSRIEKHGTRSVNIAPGDEIFTMSLMKRDTSIFYTGEPGIIHSVYFNPGISVDQGKPLIGVCAPHKLPLIKKIIDHVKAEWE